MADKWRCRRPTTVEQGKATCPMSPSGLLKAKGPMSPSQFQRVKCPSREHKPQFVPCLEKTFSSGELKLGSSVEAWEEVVWPSCKGEELPGSWEEVRGSPELGGGGLLAYEKGEELPGSWEEVRGSPELGGETSQQIPLRRSEETGPQ
ncbi:hypothetical protein Taro_000114 [Colocasia esculenta]|uniref:Uncharacterized protein n=1 Tax=Colocasia esculenta TaxID=4460 RepID=A0A843TDV9_COLES|nr:hypothetical protein [Colocasia esculenta]